MGPSAWEGGALQLWPARAPVGHEATLGPHTYNTNTPPCNSMSKRLPKHLQGMFCDTPRRNAHPGTPVCTHALPRLVRQQAQQHAAGVWSMLPHAHRGVHDIWVKSVDSRRCWVQQAATSRWAGGRRSIQYHPVTTGGRHSTALLSAVSRLPTPATGDPQCTHTPHSSMTEALACCARSTHRHAGTSQAPLLDSAPPPPAVSVARGSQQGRQQHCTWWHLSHPSAAVCVLNMP